MSLTVDGPVDFSRFTSLASDTIYCFVQLKQPGSIVIQVAADAPAVDSTEGIILESDGVDRMMFSDLDPLDNVYARSLTGEPLNVAAWFSDRAPAPV